MVVTLVLARMQSGITEASTTPQALQPMHPSVLVHHCHEVGSRPPSWQGAGYVMAGGGVAQDEGVKGLVCCQVAVRGADSLLDVLGECRDLPTAALSGARPPASGECRTLRQSSCSPGGVAGPGLGIAGAAPRIPTARYSPDAMRKPMGSTFSALVSRVHSSVA